jgi:hypothetical protein
MKINFVRSGGMAGTRLALELDTERLPPEDAERLRRLVESSDFFELEQGQAGSANLPDRFQFLLEIKSQVWGEHSLVVSEMAVPEDLRPLLQELTTLALERRRSGRDAGAQD